MKKILAACLITSGVLSAEEMSHTEQLITMQKLESSMLMIQKGFLHDNKAFIKYGTDGVQENLKSVNSFMITKDEKGFDAKKYVTNELKVMRRLVDDIAHEYELGNTTQARFLYDMTLSRCMACHKTVRK